MSLLSFACFRGPTFLVGSGFGVLVLGVLSRFMQVYEGIPGLGSCGLEFRTHGKLACKASVGPEHSLVDFVWFQGIVALFSTQDLE